MGTRKREAGGQGRLSAVQLISSDCASALPPVADVCGIVLSKTQLQILLGMWKTSQKYILNMINDIHVRHSLIIIREILIFTLPIFTALYGCIS